MSADTPSQAAQNPAPLVAGFENTPHGFSSRDAKRAARNATALALSNMISKGIQFLWQLLLARWLGAEGYGIYGTVGALLVIGSAIPEFGMGLIVIRDVATKPRDSGRYLAATLTMQPPFAVAGYMVLTLAALLLGYSAELRTLLAFAGINLLVDALGNMCHNQLLAIERMVIPALIAVGHVIALVSLAAIALAAGTGLWGLYAATLSAGLLRSGSYWLALLWLGARPEWPVDRAVMRLLLANGWPIALTSFLGLAYQHTDKLITTSLIGEAATGQLTAGFVVVFGMIELFSTTTLVAVFPIMSRVYAGGHTAMFLFMMEKLAFFNLMISLPIAIYTTLLAVPLSALLFGAEFTRTASVLQVLIWYSVVTMVANVFAQALLIENRQRRLLVIRVGGIMVNIILSLLLLPRIGVQGAAVASLCAELGVLSLMLRTFAFPADWWQRVRRHIWRLRWAALGLVGVVLVLRSAHPTLAIMGGIPAYLLLVLQSRAIEHDDWDLLYRLALAAPGGTVISRYWKRELF